MASTVPGTADDCPAMTSTTTDERVPRSAIAAAIEAAMAGSDYTTAAGWTRPALCICHQTGRSCLEPRPDRGTCEGFVASVPLPPGKAITAAELISILPQADQDGTVSAIAAGSALGQMVSERLSWNPYRRAQAFTRTGTALDSLEESLSPDHDRAAVPGFALKCQWCSGDIPPERGPKARYCRNSHRVSAHRAKKRQANAGASPGR